MVTDWGMPNFPSNSSPAENLALPLATVRLVPHSAPLHSTECSRSAENRVDADWLVLTWRLMHWLGHCRLPDDQACCLSSVRLSELQPIELGKLGERNLIFVEEGTSCRFRRFRICSQLYRAIMASVGLNC